MYRLETGVISRRFTSLALRISFKFAPKIEVEKCMKRNIWIFLAVSLLALIWAKQVYAQTPMPSDDDVNAVARQLFCPVCENTPLDVCATQACAQWRELIRTKLAQGWTADQIKEYFAKRRPKTRIMPSR